MSKQAEDVFHQLLGETQCYHCKVWYKPEDAPPEMMTFCTAGCMFESYREWAGIEEWETIPSSRLTTYLTEIGCYRWPIPSED